MGPARRAFVAADTLPRDPAWVTEALSARFALEAQAQSSSRTVWLDTADWRLHRAGLALNERGRGARRELVLDDGAQAVTVTQAARPTWPALLGQLPGPFLQSRLAPVIGVRAVQAMAEVEGRCSHWRLLDGEGKTVVRLSVEDSRLIHPRPALLPLRITVDAVRGYEPELERGAALLRCIAGVADAAGSAREAALGAAGYDPQIRPGNLDLALDAGAPAAWSVAAILMRTLETMQRNLDGVLADVDTEFLHDFRVAVRQTRAVLKTTAGALPDDVAQRFGADWRWLGQVTAPVRDLDVALLGLAGQSGELAAEGLHHLEPLREHLVRQRRSQFRRLRAALAAPRLSAMLDDWSAVLTAIPGSDVTQQSTAELAAERIRRWQQRVAKHARSLSAESDAQSLHELRKRCKELRYVSEAFASVHGAGRRGRLTKALKRLQDVLGEIQDAQVHRNLLTTFATATRPVPEPATLLVVGALLDRLGARQRSAAAKLPEALDRFSAAAKTGRRRNAMASP